MTTHLLTSPFGEISVSLDSATTGKALSDSITIHRVEYTLSFSFEACAVSEQNPEGIRAQKGCFVNLTRKNTTAAWGNASSAARKRLELYLFPLLRGIMGNKDNAFEAHRASLVSYMEKLREYKQELLGKLHYANEREQELNTMLAHAMQNRCIEDAPFCGKPVGTFNDTRACKRPQNHAGKCDHMTTFYVSLDGC